ncbi:MAG: PilZ domain-containing protein [Planctomycetota bacterium]
MPANRSRTVQWRRCLEQIHQRGGAVELAVARDYREDEAGSHLIWRIRLLHMDASELIVEQPMALGRLIPVEPGAELVVIIAIGQNRWMFSTTNLGTVEHPDGRRGTVAAMRLAMPKQVERCQRRSYYRVETAAVNLPEVEVWPLLDPKSVLVAERSNELQLEREAGRPTGEPTDMRFEDIMPEVGPKFTALLMNLGGGGVGMRCESSQSQGLARHKLFWMRIALPPELAVPICASGKLVHTHMDSSQHTYAGMAFDFTFNPGHQRVVVEQICRYIAIQQRTQLQRRSA